MSEATQYLQWWRNRLGSLLGGATHNGLRDYNQEFGYPSTVTTQDLRIMYQRNGIASRVIRAFPQATWEEQPIIRDEDGDSAEPKKQDGTDNEMFSPFVMEVNDFMIRTKALRYLERADRLSSIGHFGVLLMGFKDSTTLSLPLNGGKKELIYLAAYGEPTVEITEYVRDSASPRYGLPEMYRITPGKENGDARAPVQGSFTVHSSRVLHLAEFLEDGEVIGQPRLVPIYNHLLDLQKTVGSAGESFWRQSNPGIAFTADADAKIDQAVLDSMKDQAAEFENGMRRILAMQGVTPNTLGTVTIADPSPIIDKLLDLIAGATGIPKRILIGSERGELASSQDSDSWASRIDERQNNYAGPSILVPFIQKMIDTGNLPKPSGRFWVDWPESNALSPKDQAEVGRIRAETLAKYASSATAELIVPPQEFRRDFLQLPPESEYEVNEPDELPEDDTADVEEDAADDDTADPVAAPTINRGYRAGPDGMVIKHLKGNASPRTLYVRRDLLNADEVRDWFKGQGLGDMVEASKMHVTVAFSRTPVDWMKIGECWDTNTDGGLIIKAGGARMLDLLGAQKDVLVQLFASSSLAWRHEDMKLAGCSWDYPEYQPHISLTWTLGEDVRDRQERMAKLRPFTGQLLFGPEIFEEVKVDWQKTIKENSRA